MRWDHYLKEGLGLVLLGSLVGWSATARAADEQAPGGVGQLQIRGTSDSGPGATLQVSGEPGPGATLQLSGGNTFEGKSKENDADPPHKYWIGVVCSPVRGALRAQLDVPANQGLVAESVAPDGPAAKAGIKEFDVLLKFDDKPLGEVGDLMKAINEAGEAGKDISIQILRGGKQQTITVKVEERPKDADGVKRGGGGGSGGGLSFGGPGGPDQEAWRKWLESMPKTPGGGPNTFRTFGPGMIMPGGQAGFGNLMIQARSELPDDTTITITRHGKEPAKIVVKQGDNTYEATEDQLDKLPEKVRGLVHGMIRTPGIMSFQARLMPPAGDGAGNQGGGGGGGGGMAGGGQMGPMPRDGRDGRDGRDPRDLEQRVERQLDELSHRIDDLRESLHDLHDGRGRHDGPPRPEGPPPRAQGPNPGGA